VNQRAIIIAVETANVAATGAVAILGTLGSLHLWHMAVASAVLGVGAAFFFPAYSAYLPRILPAEQLLAANGVEGAIRPTLREGLRFVLRTAWLRWTLLFASTWVFLALGPIDVLLPFIARERFAHGEQVYGFMLAAFGFGSALGALVVSSRLLPRRYLTVMMTMWGIGSLPLAIVGATSSLTLMLARAVRRWHRRRRGHGHLGHAAAATGTAGDARPGIQPRLLRLAGIHAAVDGRRRPAVEGGSGGTHLRRGRHRAGPAGRRRTRRGPHAPRRDRLPAALIPIFRTPAAVPAP
jgi:MFS family permease